MKVWKAIALIAILIPAMGVAQKKKHNEVPEAFGTAHSIYIEAADGDYSKPGLNAADRHAIEDVQDAMKAWGRYTLAVHAEQADLIFVVRKSRGGGVDAQSGLPAAPRSNGAAGPARVPGQPGDSDTLGASAPMGIEGDRLMVHNDRRQTQGTCLDAGAARGTGGTVRPAGAAAQGRGGAGVSSRFDAGKAGFLTSC